jgi:hypothetical protein
MLACWRAVRKRNSAPRFPNSTFSLVQRTRLSRSLPARHSRSPPCTRAPSGARTTARRCKTMATSASSLACPVLCKCGVILDDVMAAGTAVRGSIERVTKAGGTVVGVIQLLDGKSRLIIRLQSSIQLLPNLCPLPQRCPPLPFGPPPLPPIVLGRVTCTQHKWKVHSQRNA